MAANVHQQLLQLVRWCSDEEKAVLKRRNEEIVVNRNEGQLVVNAYLKESEAIHDNRITVSSNSRPMQGE